MRDLFGIGYPRTLMYAALAGICFGLIDAGLWLLALIVLLAFLAGHVHAVMCQAARDANRWWPE